MAPNYIKPVNFAEWSKAKAVKRDLHFQLVACDPKGSMVIEQNKFHCPPMPGI